MRARGVSRLGLAFGLAGLVCFFALGVVFAHEGPSEELLRLDAALLREPLRLSLLLRRSEVLRRSGQLERSLRDAERACALATVEREVLFARALARVELGLLSEALIDLDRYVRSGPAGYEALQARARLHRRAGRKEEARRDWDAAIAARPLPELFLERGKLDEEASDWERARAGYREGLEATEGAVSLRFALIRAERQARRFAEALLLVEEGRAKASFQADWLLLRAEIHQAMGKPALASRDREAALLEATRQLSVRPTDLVRLTRARALYSLGRVSEAREDVLVLRERSAALPEVAELSALVGVPRESQ